ncbi:hypothetical protein KJ632_04760, partial [Patescibacteria group bacterium]|nr:hypothetical protein [Patescibacteria group bacterium]
MDFETAKEYLRSHISYEETRNFKYDENYFDLARVKRFYAAFCPAYGDLKYIHVGGSKGKGSTCALVANYLRASGRNVGMFLSPYIVEITESFWFDGADISKADFVKYVEELRDFAESWEERITYFEMLLAIVLKYFVDMGAEYVVLEVGLGGRLDATNVVEPLVSALTLVEKEHTDVLGESYEEILAEKCGIRKEGVPFLVGPQKEEVREIVERICPDARFVSSLVEEILKVVLGEVDEGMLERIRSEFKLPGRFQVEDFEGRTVVFDMAHTEASMKFLIEKLEKKFKGKNFVFLISMMRDKKHKEILEIVGEFADKIVYTSSHEERGEDPHALAKIVKGEVVEDCTLAFESSLQELKKDQVLVVTGSH